MVLGIVAGSLCLVVALFLALAIWGFASLSDIQYYFDGNDVFENMSYAHSVATLPVDTADNSDLIWGVLPFLICAGVGGALGIAGGVIVRKKHIASGVMFIIAALASFYLLICAICFILACIFAFVKEKPRLAYYPQGSPYYPYPPVYPYYPPYGTPGYGPGGAPQVPYGQQPQYGQQFPYIPQPPVAPPDQYPAVPQEMAPANIPAVDTQEGESGKPQS